MLKWSSDRSVCAPQYLSAATSIAPIESVSTRVPAFVVSSLLASGDMGVPANVLLLSSLELELRACGAELSRASTRLILQHAWDCLKPASAGIQITLEIGPAINEEVAILPCQHSPRKLKYLPLPCHKLRLLSPNNFNVFRWLKSFGSSAEVWRANTRRRTQSRRAAA